VKLGFSLPVAGSWATPENQLRIAREAEALGYASLWTLQRLIYPLKPANDYPPLPGQPWPKAFEQVVDPVITLAYVASATTRIRLGTAALVMPYYSPIVLAKMLASLDLVCSGRLDVGVGVGWSVDEYAAVGVSYRDRGRRVDEFLRCLKAIWTEDVVEFQGDFYCIPRARVEPKPMQRPHPPILIGGYGIAAVERAVKLGDGFVGGNVPLEQVHLLSSELSRRAESAGRDPHGLRIVSRGVYRVCDSAQGANRRPLWGTLQEIRDDIERYSEAGLTELFLEANVDATGVVSETDPTAAVERTLAVMHRLAQS
jgi:probable F420-dependent oxidoreductase